MFVKLKYEVPPTASLNLLPNLNVGIYEEYGFDKKIKQLEDDNSWKIIEFFKSNYIASKGVNAWLVLAKVN